MSERAEILCVGPDPVLNRTRQLILRERFAVEVASDACSALALLEAQPFRMVLLCYSLSDSDCRKIVQSVHYQSPGTRILALAPGQQRLRLSPPDAEILFGGPADLIAAATAMTSSPEADSETEDLDPGGVALDESRKADRTSRRGNGALYRM